MNQFDPRHYAFMREYRGPYKERLLLRKSFSFRESVHHGDNIVGRVALIVAILWLLAALGGYYAA